MTEETVINIGSRRELFVDRYLVDRMLGTAGLRMHPPERREVVFQVEGPLENACSGVYSVIVDSDGRYLLYYRGYYPLGEQSGDWRVEQTAHVAMSDEGIHFERPHLGIYDLADEGHNNVVWQGYQAHNLVPFLDPRPDVDDEKRYKAVGGSGERKLYGLFSPDGVHWKLAQEDPLDIDGAFDSANVPLWDPLKGKYRLFSRYFDKQEDRGVRAIQSCESDDFIHWTEPVPHHYGEDIPAEQLYTNATTPCPGAEHILLSFPKRFVPEREAPVDISEMDYPGKGLSDAVMMSSRDGVHWDRTFMEAWLQPGLDERNWTHRNQTPAVGILQTSQTEWSMYAAEHYGWPDNRLRRLAIRPWGFASASAGFGGGELITKSVTFEGKELEINFRTSAAGSIRVEIQNAEGEPLRRYALDDCEELYGDEIGRTVSWGQGTDMGEFAGCPVRLRFAMQDADLFALQFR